MKILFKKLENNHLLIIFQEDNFQCTKKYNPSRYATPPDFRKIMLLPLRKKRSFFLSELFKESIKDPIKKYKNRRNKHDGKKNNQKNRNNCKPMN